ncbi:MAG: hypothetical protein U9N61_02985 [Euryarchaeota archaeon]|nr:hypothetical protein [Euryarchaeota archaeon]
MKWMEEARELSAQCWCDAETENKEMDVVLAEAVAKRIAYWMRVAAQNQRNADYYRRLVHQIGETIGEESYIQDDGGLVEDVSCAKVPGLVKDLVAKNKRIYDKGVLRLC